MKKALLGLLLLICLALPLFANSQKYYAVSSNEWQLVNWLCHYARVSGPTSNGPVQQAQLEVALQRAENVVGQDNAVAKYLRACFNQTSSLYLDDFGEIALTGILYPEVYFQTNKPFGEDDETIPTFAIDQDWFVKSQKDRSTANITLENTLGDFLYARMSLDYKQKVSREIENSIFHTSLFGGEIHQNVPLDAGISLGTKGFSFIMGRGKVSLGEGYTGNTAIGDNYEYQEFMKFGFYTKRTAVTLTLTSFDSGRATLERPEDERKDDINAWHLLSSRFSGYRELRQSVTYELMPVDNFKASLSFVTLIDTNTAFDFRYLNPFMVMHNYFNYHDPKAESSTLEANNMISVDFSWAIAKKWNVYAQITMDQFQIQDEAEGYLGFGYTEPNAFGGLLNVSYSDYIADGILNLYVETAYNMPGMYLNTKYYDDNDQVTQYIGNKEGDSFTSLYTNRCWSQDYLMGYFRTESDYNDVAYSGYKYGPDCFVLSLGGGYQKISGYEVCFSALYMVHGEKGRGSAPENYTFDGIDYLESVNRVALYTKTGALEHTLALRLTGSYNLLPWLKLQAGAAYSYRWNYRNTEGANFGNFQAYLGFAISKSSLAL